MSAPELSLLAKRRFLPLFATQFLGAFNDNLYRSAMLFLVSFTLYRGEADRAAMVAVILAALWQWPEWGEWSPLTRVARLGIVMGTAGGAFVVALFAAGFRLRDLRS